MYFKEGTNPPSHEVWKHVDYHRSFDHIESEADVDINVVFVPTCVECTCEPPCSFEMCSTSLPSSQSGSPTKARLLALQTTCITVSRTGRDTHSKSDIFQITLQFQNSARHLKAYHFRLYQRPPCIQGIFPPSHHRKARRCCA